MTALAFKPWARDATEATALKDVLARVNVERGHFRDITEASLQEEIAGEGALELSESEDEDEEDDVADAEQAKAKPKTREELYKAKFEMLQHVAAAEQDVLMALDFVSLLISKDAPGLANATISPALRQQVPTATLGTDVWQRMPQDKARQGQDELLATNVRMESLQESADSLLAAANRLQENVRKETQYWDQILSISEKGWNVCRIPGQQHRLGVTFGFSESSPEFSRRGIAALNAGPDGSIALERGVGSKPKALRVLLQRNGEVIGSSRVPSPPDEGETTLEARIRYARDSLFDEELYHEMIRESRSQASIGVSMRGNTIYFKPSHDHDADVPELLLDLVSLDDVEDHSADSQAQSSLAQSIALAARLLLSHAYRERLKKRSEVPRPLSEKTEERRNLPILRPIMSFVLHRLALQQVNAHLTQLQTLLSGAKIEAMCGKAGFSFSHASSTPTAESLVATLMQRWLSDTAIEIPNQNPDQKGSPFTIKITIETTLAYNSGTIFALAGQGDSTVRFSLFSDLREAVDAALASGLARYAAGLAGEGWTCVEREGLLVSDEDDSGQRHSAWVTLNTDERELSFNISGKEVSLENTSEPNNPLEAFGKTLGSVL